MRCDGFLLSTDLYSEVFISQARKHLRQLNMVRCMKFFKTGYQSQSVLNLTYHISRERENTLNLLYRVYNLEIIDSLLLRAGVSG